MIRGCVISLWRTLFSYNLTGIPILLHTYQCEKNDIYKLLPQKQHIR